MGDLIDTVVGLLPQLKELPVLLKVAADLGRDVPPDAVQNVRMVRRLLLLYLNGAEVENAADIVNVLGGVVEDINAFLFPEPEADVRTTRS